jgi:trigger factor
LLEKNPVDVPRSLIEGEVRELQTQQSNQGLDASVLETSAERRVKLGVLVNEVVNRNQLQIDPDRVRDAVESVAASYENPEEVIQYYYGNQEMLAGVQQAVMEEQVVDWVLEHEDIKVEDTQTSFDGLVEAAKQSKG